MNENDDGDESEQTTLEDLEETKNTNNEDVANFKTLKKYVKEKVIISDELSKTN